jgi:thioesterase domain-containing protein
LGGASLGGTIALEMAQQLQMNGEEVSLLIMFDHAPDVIAENLAANKKMSAQAYHFLTNSIQWVKSFRAMGSEQVIQRASRKARVSLKMLNGKSARKNSNRVDAGDLLDYGSELPEFRQKMIETHWHAINNYRAASYNQPVLLLQAKSQPLISTEKPEDTWVHLASEQLTVITVPGSHEGMFHEPHVHKLAQELRSQLDLVQAVHVGSETLQFG